MDELVGQLKGVVKKEKAWREYVRDTGLGNYSPHVYPVNSLDQFFAVEMLQAWASASGFPAVSSSADCAKLAAELASWPKQLRLGATPLVFEWCMGGALAHGDAQKLSEAVLQK